MTPCAVCGFKNLDFALQCISCGAVLLDSSGAPLPPVADLSTHLGHTVAYLQFYDLAAAASAGEVAPSTLRKLLDELTLYLHRQAARFAAFPPLPEQADYSEGVAGIRRGLQQFGEVVGEARQHSSPGPADWASWLLLVEQADDAVAAGVALLDAEHARLD